MKSFNEWRAEKEEAIQENFALGVSSPTILGLDEAKAKKKKMFGDEEMEDEGGELATAAEPKDADIDADEEEDESEDCGSKFSKKKCKKMKKEGCGDEKEKVDIDVDKVDDDDDEEEEEELAPNFAMMKKQKKKQKKEGYNPNETEEEFLSSIMGQAKNINGVNKDGISEYLEDAVFGARNDNQGISNDPQPGEVGFSPYSRIGELGGSFEEEANRWTQLKNFALGIRPE